jgi:hypothetical protein
MQRYLLPYRWKFAGIALTGAGILSAIFYVFFDFRFKLPVFAVYSSFLETKFFSTFQTNFSEELILLLLISGFSLIVFSREKTESEIPDSLRLKAFMKAMLFNNIFLLFSVLFVYGSGFVAVLIGNVFSLTIIYLLLFYLSKNKLKFNKNS